MLDKPHLIFNLDEKGLTTEHKPPHIVASSHDCPLAVTSGKGQTVTLIGCGSASGTAIPPFFVFPGKRMNESLLAGKSPGAAATMSDSGWSNHAIFRQYLVEHFVKYAPGRDNEKCLIVLDGHKSHVSVGLTEWARDHGIILFILPAHTSHILQPMDVSCFGPFEKMFNAECHKLTRLTSATVTRYNVCELACKVYCKSLSPENLHSGFRRTGIFPLNPDAIPKDKLLPAEVYVEDDHFTDSQATIEGGIIVEPADHFFSEKEQSLKKTKTEKKKA